MSEILQSLFSVKKNRIGGCAGFWPNWETYSGCVPLARMLIMYQDISHTACLARGPIGERSQTRPRRSIRPDMLVLALMPWVDFRHAFPFDSEHAIIKDDKMMAKSCNLDVHHRFTVKKMQCLSANATSVKKHG